MLKRFVSLIIIFIFIIACSSPDDSNNKNGDGTDGFNRSALLENIADNMAIPAFQDLQSKLSVLDLARENFVNDMSQSNLDALSAPWLSAYKTWQYVEMFNLGQADNLGGGDFGFVSFFNIYPVTVSDIENGAKTGSYDLNTSNYHDAQGFASLDFLIHGTASGDSNPLDKFTTNSDAAGYVTYMTDVVAQMNALNNSILSDWQNSYRDTFVSNTASGLNGALNMLVNDFIFYYEKGFRANKIGIPAGVFSNGSLPEKVEAFYKQDVSKELALEALTAIEDMFNGRAYNGNATSESFKSYLQFLDRGDLATAINNQFTAARTSIDGLNNSFYQQSIDDNNQMLVTYDVIQAAVPLLKVDMAQAFSVVIDFVDADGD